MLLILINLQLSFERGMDRPVKIKNALVSVFYKDRLEPLVQELDRLGVSIFSTGGTQTFIEGLGIKVTPVENITNYPSILGGRVKTLHPKVFGGILGRRGNSSDQLQLEEYEIPEFDLVIVDLYPFEETVKSAASEEDIIEKIDIGGISLIRAAAKNFKDVVIVPERGDYDYLLSILKEHKGSTFLNHRRKLAEKAFQLSSSYDSAIASYFSGNSDAFFVRETQSRALRYGENPHQKGSFYGPFEEIFDQLHGKELSYNNILDVDAAVNLISDFKETTFAILKHNNACGIASRKKPIDAWKAALAADPVSAFGGILITNVAVDEETAEEINKLFFEVIIAPSYASKALEVLKQKKNRIILLQKNTVLPQRIFRTVLNGVIVQDRDTATEGPENLSVKTKTSPTALESVDLLFANKVAKHTKSNTIVLVRDQQMLASGVGQTSRVDALRQAIAKAKAFGFDLKGSVMASDAFFPFPDCVEIAHTEGINAVIQPGGSVKDVESIDYCDKNQMAMVFTGVRHFKH